MPPRAPEEMSKTQELTEAPVQNRTAWRNPKEQELGRVSTTSKATRQVQHCRARLKRLNCPQLGEVVRYGIDNIKWPKAVTKGQVQRPIIQ